MNQDTPLIGPVPMNSASRTPNNIPNRQLLRNTALVTDPARPRLDFEDLTVLVVVPVCAGTGGECRRHHGDAFFLLVEDAVVPDFASKGWALLESLAVFRPGGADDCHRHLGGGWRRLWCVEEDVVK